MDDEVDRLNELEDERYQLTAQGLDWAQAAKELESVVQDYERAKRTGRHAFRLQVSLGPFVLRPPQRLSKIPEP